MTLTLLLILSIILASSQAGEIWIGTSPFCEGSRRDCENNGMTFVRSDKSGDGKRCWTGEKVLCRDNPQQLPFVWFGTSPICEGSSNDCDIFDLNYIRSDSSGDGKKCLSGSKVLCQIKQVNSSHPDNNPDHFNLITYNVFGRPFIITHDGQRERTCHIPRALFARFANSDVIVFQEVFMEGCLPEIPLRKLLEFYGFKYNTPTVGEDVSGETGITFINGGVFIASRWPIIYHSQEIFKDATTFEADRLSRKGVMYAKINKLGQSYHVFGTHLQAQEGDKNDEIRVLQARQMLNFMKKQTGLESSSERVIVAGDLNADNFSNPNHAQRIENTLNIRFLTKSNSSLPCTSCRDLNVLVGPSYPYREWLDYVGISRSHAQPKSAEMSSVALRSDKDFSFCNSAPLQPNYVFPNSNFCKTKLTTNELSDHFPVVANMKF